MYLNIANEFLSSALVIFVILTIKWFYSQSSMVLGRIDGARMSFFKYFHQQFSVTKGTVQVDYVVDWLEKYISCIYKYFDEWEGVFLRVNP